ncbi:hypothetical protein BGW80DRAFT_1271356 [Lactifluus volemus]|nr:hypothetical protein BGW80DRAFT_1271356 [Lactifluus volemus]
MSSDFPQMKSMGPALTVPVVVGGHVDDTSHVISGHHESVFFFFRDKTRSSGPVVICAPCNCFRVCCARGWQWRW